MSINRQSFTTTATDFNHFKPIPHPISQTSHFKIQDQEKENASFRAPPPPIQMQSQLKDYVPKNTLPPMLQLDNDFLPQEILFLLSEEETHIQKFRQKVEREKTRIKKDVEGVKLEIVNMIEDLAVQMQSFVDEHYKRYTSVYAMFKDEVMHFKSAKLEAPLNMIPPPQNINNDCSNANLIRELEEMRYKNYVSKVNNYVSELAKQRLEKIQLISKDLLQLTASDCNLYNSDNTVKQLNGMRSGIEERLITKFANMSDYIQPLDFIFHKPQSQPSHSHSSSSSFSNVSANKTNPPQQLSNVQQHAHPYLDRSYTQLDQQKSFNQSMPNLNHQGIGLQAPGLNTLQKQQAVQIFDSHTCSTVIKKNPQELAGVQCNQSEMLLCLTHIRDELIATGSRDGCIRVYEKGQIVQELKHPGGICALTVIRLQGLPLSLVSGSDNGSIKVWSLQFEELNILEGHTAAVVALISVEDVLISGSYDKTIIVWDTERGIIQKLQQHESAITCLAKGNQRFVSGSLDGTLNIWKTSKRAAFEATLERSVRNNSLVTALQINNNKIYSGGKDGKIREFDIFSGELILQYVANVGPIVEIICMNDKILSMSNKNSNLSLSSQGEQQIIDLNDQASIEFGCGVYPKMEVALINNTPQILLVNQSRNTIHRFALQ